MEKQFSDYIVYVDESGDHSLTSINPEYPLFVLAFCIVNKLDYSEEIVPRFQTFKFRHFGHDIVILHENSISKAKNIFKFLTNSKKREVFLSELNNIVDNACFKIVSIIIHKKTLVKKYKKPENPYHLALEYGLNEILNFIVEKNQSDYTTHVIFESRGKKEDFELKNEFITLKKNSNHFPFEIQFADKRTNSCGLQLADLVARPIGKYVLNPTQPNRAYSTIKNKLYTSKMSSLENSNELIIFP